MQNIAPPQLTRKDRLIKIIADADTLLLLVIQMAGVMVFASFCRSNSKRKDKDRCHNNPAENNQQKEGIVFVSMLNFPGHVAYNHTA